MVWEIKGGVWEGKIVVRKGLRDRIIKCSVWVWVCDVDIFIGKSKREKVR